MLKLKNIKMENDLIEADYYPESEKEKFGHVSFNLNTKEETYNLVEDYGRCYSRMALTGLKSTIEMLNKHEISKLPTERLVMWY